VDVEPSQGLDSLSGVPAAGLLIAHFTLFVIGPIERW
jgi:hypothetical protein